MLAERERIEGIRQIEVAWSRVPGAESTGLHTAHPKPRSLSYSFALLPRRSPSFSRVLFSFPLSLSNSPSPSLSYTLRSTVASSSLSPSSSLGGIRASSSLSSHSIPLSLSFCTLSSSSFPNSKFSCRFPFRSLSRCYSECRRSSRGNQLRCLPPSSTFSTLSSSSSSPLDRYPLSPTWLACSLSLCQPPTSSYLSCITSTSATPPSSTLHHPRRQPSATRRRVRLSYREPEPADKLEPPNGKCNYQVEERIEMERTAVLAVRLPSSFSSSIFPSSLLLAYLLRFTRSCFDPGHIVSFSPAGFLRSRPSFFRDLSSVCSRVSPRPPPSYPPL